MLWAKQSTAATFIIGPILDSTGAEYIGAVIGDLSLSKNGGTLTALAAAATLTHIANGQYTLVMTTGNLDTLGRAQVTCNKSTYQMPTLELMVIPATVFDALVTNAAGGANGFLLSDANGRVDLGKILGVAQSATDLKDFADTGYDPATHKVQGVVLTDTATNLTNAPTTGDLTAAMRASVNAEADTALADAKAGYAIAIEAAILNEGDATALLAAIAAKVEEFLINEGDATATIAAIATACNAAIAAGTVGTNAATAATQATAANAIVGSGTHGNAALKTIIDTKSSQASVDDVPTAAENAAAVAAQITTDHGAGSYVRNTEPDNAGIAVAVLAAAAAESAASDAADNTTALPSLIESSGGHNRYKATALETAPTGSGGGGGGSGVYAITITVNDGVDPVQDATVTLAINASRYTGDVTDVDGETVLAPNEGAGTYEVRIAAAGYEFTPASLVVTGDTAQTYSVSAVAITPSDPAKTTGYLTVRTAAGIPAEAVDVELQITRFAAGSTGSGISVPSITLPTNASGYVEFIDLPRLAAYRLRIADASGWYEGVTADDETTPLVSILGEAVA